MRTAAAPPFWREPLRRHEVTAWRLTSTSPRLDRTRSIEPPPQVVKKLLRRGSSVKARRLMLETAAADELLLRSSSTSNRNGNRGGNSGSGSDSEDGSGRSQQQQQITPAPSLAAVLLSVASSEELGSVCSAFQSASAETPRWRHWCAPNAASTRLTASCPAALFVPRCAATRIVRVRPAMPGSPVHSFRVIAPPLCRASLPPPQAVAHRSDRGRPRRLPLPAAVPGASLPLCCPRAAAIPDPCCLPSRACSCS